MSIGFFGSTHATHYLKLAAKLRGNDVAEDSLSASVTCLFISEDTPTDEDGNRDLEWIKSTVAAALERTEARQIVLTSQVPPGFTRMLDEKYRGDDLQFFHQAETLRMKDAFERAMAPDYIIVGGPYVPCDAYGKYLISACCPLHFVSWEDAEFSKIAVNMMLAAQVDATNTLSEVAQKVGANWENVCKALRSDRRIGPQAYLDPGDWRQSRHLLRDAVTLEQLKNAQR